MRKFSPSIVWQVQVRSSVSEAVLPKVVPRLLLPAFVAQGASLSVLKARNAVTHNRSGERLKAPTRRPRTRHTHAEEMIVLSYATTRQPGRLGSYKGGRPGQSLHKSTFEYHVITVNRPQLISILVIFLDTEMNRLSRILQSPNRPYCEIRITEHFCITEGRY